jgi:hypothetical protein
MRVQVPSAVAMFLTLTLALHVPVQAALLLTLVGVPVARAVQQRRRGPAVEHRDPFDDGTSDREWREDFRFTRDDVRTLARALGLPRVIVLPSGHRLDRDIALLFLLARHVYMDSPPRVRRHNHGLLVTPVA